MSTTGNITVYQADTWFSMADHERCAIKDWLIEHDIDPREIPPSEPIIIKGDKVHYWGMTIEESEGKVMKVKSAVNSDGEPCVVVDEREVDLKTPPPSTLTNDVD